MRELKRQRKAEKPRNVSFLTGRRIQIRQAGWKRLLENRQTPAPFSFQEKGAGGMSSVGSKALT
jgi:hypothetical protein